MTTAHRLSTATVAVLPDLWCRWASEAEALKLAPPTELSADPTPGLAEAPAWRRREHDAGRRLLASLLRDTLPGFRTGSRSRPDIAAVRLTGNGKPVLTDQPGVGISVSHSYPMVAVAIGYGYDLGVDVESPGPGRAAERLWDWTIREACVKVTGAGVGGRPDRIRIGGGSERSRESEGSWGEVRWRALRAVAPAPLSVAWRPATAGRTTSATGGWRSA